MITFRQSASKTVITPTKCLCSIGQQAKQLRHQQNVYVLSVSKQNSYDTSNMIIFRRSASKTVTCAQKSLLFAAQLKNSSITHTRGPVAQASPFSRVVPARLSAHRECAARGDGCRGVEGAGHVCAAEEKAELVSLAMGCRVLIKDILFNRTPKVLRVNGKPAARCFLSDAPS